MVFGEECVDVLNDEIKHTANSLSSRPILNVKPHAPVLRTVKGHGAIENAFADGIESVLVGSCLQFNMMWRPVRINHRCFFVGKG